MNHAGAMKVPERPLTPPEPNYPEPTQQELDMALDEITDELINGKCVAGWTMEAVLDCEADEGAGGKFARELATVLDVWADDASAASLWLRALAYQKRLVKKHIPEDVIEERAYDNMAEDA